VGDGSTAGWVVGVKAGVAVPDAGAEAGTVSVGAEAGWAAGSTEVSGLLHAAAMNTIASNSTG